MKYKLGIIVGLILIALSTAGENWPGWRGTGNGVSNETDLPFVWGTDLNILWKTHIEGHGISSPIVWGKRVFVTTATSRSATLTNPGITLALTIAAMVLAVLSYLFRKKRKRNMFIMDEDRPHRIFKWIERIDRLISPLSIFLFLASVGIIFSKNIYFDPIPDTMAWRWTSPTVFFALTAVVGFYHIGSRLRLVGVIIMIASVLFFLFAGPSRLMNIKELFMIGWPVIIAMWWCILYFAVHYSTTKRQTFSYTTVWDKLTMIALLLTAIWQFLAVNYVQPHNEWARKVICLDRDTGKIIWNQMVLCTPQLRKHILNSYATPTPVTDGKYVIADFGPGMVCLDFNGTIQWKRLQPDFTRYLIYGSGASPIIYGDLVIHTFFPESLTHSLPEECVHTPRVIAFNKKTGKVVWQKSPLAGHNSYNTSVIGKIGTTPALFMVGWEHLLTYNPLNGDKLKSWAIPVIQCVSSLVTDETKAYVRGIAIKLTASSANGVSPFCWEASRNFHEMSSPVLFDDLLYRVKMSGTAICLDAKTGKVVWKEKLGGGKYHASVCYGDGKIYFVSIKGDTIVVRAGRKYELLAKNSIGEETQASLAFSDGKIFLRGRNHLYCIAKNSTYDK